MGFAATRIVELVAVFLAAHGTASFAEYAATESAVYVLYALALPNEATTASLALHTIRLYEI